MESPRLCIRQSCIQFRFTFSSPSIREIAMMVSRHYGVCTWREGKRHHHVHCTNSILTRNHHWNFLDGRILKWKMQIVLYIYNQNNTILPTHAIWYIDKPYRRDHHHRHDHHHHSRLYIVMSLPFARHDPEELKASDHVVTARVDNWKESESLNVYLAKMTGRRMSPY